MIELDVLRIADVYDWLGCQKLTAQQLGCNQSTVSRRAGEVQRFGARLRASGAADLLRLERQVHQCWRFSKAMDLRLHAYRWINPLLHRHLPGSWVVNPAAVSVTKTSPIELLQEHVIDALLAPWPVVADLDPSRYELTPVYSTPLLLLAPSDSLLSREMGLQDRDIAAASHLGTLDFVPPTASDCSRHLDEHLFGAAPVPGMDEAEERCGPGLDGSGQHPAGVTVSMKQGSGRDRPRRDRTLVMPSRYWGTPLTPLVRSDLALLDFQTSIAYTEALVCLRDWREHAEILVLLQAVRQALADLPMDRPGMERLAIA